MLDVICGWPLLLKWNTLLTMATTKSFTQMSDNERVAEAFQVAKKSLEWDQVKKYISPRSFWVYITASVLLFHCAITHLGGYQDRERLMPRPYDRKAWWILSLQKRLLINVDKSDALNFRVQNWGKICAKFKINLFG